MKKTYVKRMAALLLTGGLLAGVPEAAASPPYYSYTYSYANGVAKDVAAPLAYQVGGMYTGTDLGCTLGSPEDLVTDGEGNLYLVDSAQNAVYVLDAGLRCTETITAFDNAGEPDGFKSPSGLFVDEDGLIYVADTGNKRIVVLGKDRGLLRTVEEPENEILDANFSFQPKKLVVDSAGRMFVLVQNVNKGLMQFSPDGDFVGYVGSNEVVYTLAELMWKAVMTEEQKKQLLSFVPVDYANISLDANGFIYAVTSAADTADPIRRLNPSGKDVLVRAALSGSTKVNGDVLYTEDRTQTTYGPSAFVDITQDESGNYYALDGKRGRIFAYDEEGNLLFIFGGLRTAQKGTFEEPSALLYLGGRLYVLDKSYASLTVFEPTEYTTLLHEATAAYIGQRYEECIEKWNQVLRLNSNFDLAYMKAGYAYYRLQRYEEAMACFKTANAKSAYSKAYVKQKKLRMNEQFPYYFGGAAVLFAALLIGLRVRRRLRRRRSAQ